MPGRWPANVILSPYCAAALDQQSGVTRSPKPYQGQGDQGNSMFKGTGGVNHDKEYADEGGASRFFLQAGYEPWELEWILASGLRPCGE